MCSLMGLLAHKNVEPLVLPDEEFSDTLKVAEYFLKILLQNEFWILYDTSNKYHKNQTGSICTSK